ncbi:MAG: 3-deoxy-7-phosphoheptulonate synthase [candidate division Zixibacteria bacterium]|nr:3-deoxy-7-phosphoheptulonate synthase [candidate division Zixibacteria bacterium]
MLVTMNAEATVKQTGTVIQKIEELGYRPHLSSEGTKTVVAMIGAGQMVPPDIFLDISGVEASVYLTQPFKLVSRAFKKDSTEISVNGLKIGGDTIVVMAGPCAVESREQIESTAKYVAAAGAKILRGGAFKPRTSPYSFQGLGEEGLRYMRDAADKYELKVVTEVMTPDKVALVAKYSDILQIGTRNMQNYSLLEAVGKITKPVLLKRGMMSTIEELLMSAEYIMAGGNPNVILCERGIRSFEKYTRNTLDISAVPIIKQLSHLPIIVDPSHATGKRELVGPVSKSAVAVGADGLMIETHPNPEEALSDGPQSLYPDEFSSLMNSLKRIAEVENRNI